MSGAIVALLGHYLYLRVNPPQPVPPNQICTSYSRDTFGEKLEHFKEVVERYKNTHAVPISRDLQSSGLRNKSASRICTFPLDTLKKFLYYLEVYASRSQIKTGALAVNMFYTVYDSSEFFGGLHTLHMVPAVYDPEHKLYASFDPRSTVNNPLGEIDYYSDIMVSPATLGGQLLFQLPAGNMPKGISKTTAATYVRNRGSECPSLCPPEDQQFLDAVSTDFSNKNQTVDYVH